MKRWTRHHYRLGVHLIWATKHRVQALDPELRRRLHRILEQICIAEGCRPYAVGGWSDHVHVYALLGPKVSVVRLVNVLKANSSRWIRTHVPALGQFEWQRGYAVIGVDPHRDAALRRYIASQETAHRVQPVP